MFDFLFIVKWYFFGRLKIGRKSRKKNAFAEFNRVLSNLNKGSYVIDCGANVGEFTKLFLEKGFFVDAFEPDPIAINELKKKCKNNKNLNLFQSAMGLKDNTQKLFRYRKFDENDVDGYDKLLKTSKDIFEIGFEKLSDKPFISFWEMAKQIPSLIKLKSYLTVSQLVNSKLKNKYLRKAFSIHPLLVGGNPFTTTSIYALIHYLERKWGVYFCMGGTGKIVRELENLMLRQGITVNKETDVEQISIINGKAENVVLNNGKKIPADLVICNADPPTVYSEMLPSEYSRDSLLKPKKFTHYSMGLYVLFFGSKKKFSDVAHHTIWMSERYKELLHDIFEKKILTEDFSLYLHRPTATDDTFAPEGCDSFYVLCPVPNLQGNVQWNSEGPKLKDRIVEALDKTIMPGLKENIEAEFWMTPEDFKNDYRSKYGAGFSVAPIFSQSAWFRYHNKDKKIPNLYFSAAGSHPGAGIPGVLCSAKVIEKLIIKDFKVSH